MSSTTGDLRPDNFYVASEADKMVESLTARSSGSCRRHRLGGRAGIELSPPGQPGTTIFQPSFYSPSWRGELSAYR